MAKFYNYKTILSLIKLASKSGDKIREDGIGTCLHDECPDCKEGLIHYDFYFDYDGTHISAKAKCPKCDFILKGADHGIWTFRK